MRFRQYNIHYGFVYVPEAQYRYIKVRIAIYNGLGYYV